MLGHEKFEAYQLSIKFLEVALRLHRRIPPGNSSLCDQLKRAAISVPLNIAEGSGKTQKKDRSRFYAIARGSAMECAAICDVIAILDRRVHGEISQAKELLKSIVGILSKICVG